MNPADAQSADLPARHICLIAPNMGEGGTERVMLILCEALLKEKKCKVDLVLRRRRGRLLSSIPDGVRLFILEYKLRSWTWGIHSPKATLLHRINQCLDLPQKVRRRIVHGKRPAPLAGAEPPLVERMADYIDAEKPDVVLGFMAPAFITSLLARRLSDYKPRIINSVHLSLGGLPSGMKPQVVKLLPESDLVQGVSKDLVRSLSKIGVAEEKLVTIYNPVWNESLVKRKEQPLDHPWLKRKDGAKTIISAGRLAPQKDYETLVQAFRLVTRKCKARLIILGDGGGKRALEELTRKLGIESQVLLPGFVENPLPWFVRSDLFALSSLAEGLPTVLIEALACGCPVVSTDCPHGPREILQDGRFGKLVSLDNSGKADPEKLSEAMQATLDSPPDPNELVNRAKFFSEERAIIQYKKMLGVPD